jgi:hypothetical protein
MTTEEENKIIVKLFREGKSIGQIKRYLKVKTSVLIDAEEKAGELLEKHFRLNEGEEWYSTYEVLKVIGMDRELAPRNLKSIFEKLGLDCKTIDGIKNYRLKQNSGNCELISAAS